MIFAVKPLKNVLETAREMGASKFVQYAEDSGLGPELAAAGAVTLFAPLDHAFDVRIPQNYIQTTLNIQYTSKTQCIFLQEF